MMASIDQRGLLQFFLSVAFAARTEAQRQEIADIQWR
jgi:hypothetical protein